MKLQQVSDTSQACSMVASGGLALGARPGNWCVWLGSLAVALLAPQKQKGAPDAHAQKSHKHVLVWVSECDSVTYQCPWLPDPPLALPKRLRKESMTMWQESSAVPMPENSDVRSKCILASLASSAGQSPNNFSAISSLHWNSSAMEPGPAGASVASSNFNALNSNQIRSTTSAERQWRRRRNVDFSDFNFNDLIIW